MNPTSPNKPNFRTHLLNTFGTSPHMHTWGENVHSLPGDKYIRSQRKSWFHGPGSQSNQPFLWLKCYLEARLSSKTLELMIGFLAYLELKLWLTNRKLDINSNPTKGNLGHFG